MKYSYEYITINDYFTIGKIDNKFNKKAMKQSNNKLKLSIKKWPHKADIITISNTYITQKRQAVPAIIQKNRTYDISINLDRIHPQRKARIVFIPR